MVCAAFVLLLSADCCLRFYQLRNGYNDINEYLETVLFKLSVESCGRCRYVSYSIPAFLSIEEMNSNSERKGIYKVKKLDCNS